MGFGLLILGYFLTFAFTISEAYFFADVVGALIVLYACSKLSEYNGYFKYAAVIDMVFTLLALISGILLSMRLLSTGGTLATCLNIAKAAAGCVLHIFLFLGTRGIALGADCKGLAEKAMSRLVMIVVYYVSWFGTLALSLAAPAYASYMSFVVYIYFWVCLIANVLLFHTCFGMLYPAEGDPMQDRKPSKIGIFRKLDESFDKLDEKKNAYRRESMEMALEEAQRLAKEKEKKYGAKKKKKK